MISEQNTCHFLISSSSGDILLPSFLYILLLGIFYFRHFFISSFWGYSTPVISLYPPSRDILLRSFLYILLQGYSTPVISLYPPSRDILLPSFLYILLLGIFYSRHFYFLVLESFRNIILVDFLPQTPSDIFRYIVILLRTFFYRYQILANFLIFIF